MASSSSKTKKTVALGKKAKIDSAQRNMLIFVGIASVIFGVTIVAVVYFAKLIAFNNKLIGAKEDVITAYKETQENLRSISNQINTLSENDYLESVARMRNDVCGGYGNDSGDGDDENKEKNSDGFTLDSLERARECSALRVITDAMPYTVNIDSTLTSLYVLLSRAEDGSRIDSVRQRDLSGKGYEDMSFTSTSVNISFMDDATRIRNSLASIERSIRVFNPTVAVLSFRVDDEGNDAGLELNATYEAYNGGTSSLGSVRKTICAKADNENCAKAGGDGTIQELGLNGG